jgi:hypothetical protein
VIVMSGMRRRDENVETGLRHQRSNAAPAAIALGSGKVHHRSKVPSYCNPLLAKTHGGGFRTCAS